MSKTEVKTKLFNWADSSLCSDEPLFDITVRENWGIASASAKNSLLNAEGGEMIYKSTSAIKHNNDHEIYINFAKNREGEAKEKFLNAFNSMDYIEGIEMTMKIMKYKEPHPTSVYSYIGFKIGGVNKYFDYINVTKEENLGKEFTFRIPFTNLNEKKDSIEGFILASPWKALTEMEFVVGDVYVYGINGDPGTQVEPHDDDSKKRTGFTGIEYDLKWMDDFDGDELDKSVWDHCPWVHNNNEIQAYDPEMVIVKDSVCTMRMELADEPVFTRKERDQWLGNRWTLKENKTRLRSGDFLSKGKLAFQHGMIEAKVKAPYGEGVWAIFWTVGAPGFGKANWPWDGEVDIFEFVGGVGKEGGEVESVASGVDSRNNRYPAAIHYCDPDATFDSGPFGGWGGAHLSSGSESWKVDGKLADGWHIVGMEWTDKEIIFYMDGRMFFSFPISDAPDSRTRGSFFIPHTFIFQLAAGGPGSWPGDAHNNEVLKTGKPLDFDVDWVKIWQSDEVPGTKLIK